MDILDGNFLTWNPAVETVTGPAEYTAEYKEITAVIGNDNYYTGSEMVPKATVKSGSVELVEGTDYTVSCSDINAGPAVATFTGIGKYKGEVEKGFEILKAKLTVTAEDKTVFFPENAPEFTVKYEGFVGKEGKSVLGGTLDFDCEYDGSVYAEAFDITPKGLESNNYDITFMKGTLTVKGATVPEAVTGLVYNGETQTGVSECEGYTLSGHKAVDAGTYTATAILDEGRFWFDGTVGDRTIEWSIAKAKLTAAYPGETVTHGTEPSLTVTVTGFVNGETAETAAGYAAPTISNDNIDIGTYTLTPAGGSALNYDFEYMPGTLIIKGHSGGGVPWGTIAAVSVLATVAVVAAVWFLRRK